MFTDFISPQDKLWGRILQQAPHDFYHLPEYISFTARHEGGRAVAFVARTGDQALLVPMLMRPLPPDLESDPACCDLLTPYGYPGPVLAGNPSDHIVAEMLRRFVSAAKERGAVSAFWRLHPLLPFPRKQLEAIGTLIQHGSTVYVNLSQTPEQLWRETSNNHRRNIKQLQQKGFVVVRNDWRHWDSFIEIYWEAMARVEAPSFYFFSKAYFDELKETLAQKLDFWTVLSPESEVAAAAIFITEDGIVQYHLGATPAKFLDSSPLKLLISEVRLWACQAEHRLLHLGGGVGGAMDSLYTFKARFSPLSADFFTFRSVLTPDLYADLTLKRERNITGPGNNESGFFPAYRLPGQ